jgi:hypothetical protein
LLVIEVSRFLEDKKQDLVWQEPSTKIKIST